MHGHNICVNCTVILLKEFKGSMEGENWVTVSIVLPIIVSIFFCNKNVLRMTLTPILRTLFRVKWLHSSSEISITLNFSPVSGLRYSLTSNLNIYYSFYMIFTVQVSETALLTFLLKEKCKILFYLLFYKKKNKIEFKFKGRTKLRKIF